MAKEEGKIPHTSTAAATTTARISARSTSARLGTTMNNMEKNDNKVNSNK